jgi:hypothetical protein
MFFCIFEQYLGIEFIHTKLDKSAFLWSTHDMKYHLLAGAIALAFLGCDAEVVPSPPDLGAVDGGGTSMNDASPAEVPSVTEPPLTISVWCGETLLPGEAQLTLGFQGGQMLYYTLGVPAFAGKDAEVCCQLHVSDEEMVPETLQWVGEGFDSDGLTDRRMIFLDWSKQRVAQETALPTPKSLVCGVRTSAGSTEHFVTLDVVLR